MISPERPITLRHAKETGLGMLPETKWGHWTSRMNGGIIPNSRRGRSNTHAAAFSKSAAALKFAPELWGENSRKLPMARRE